MQTTMNPIELKGFVLGYMHKMAERSLSAYEAANEAGADDPESFTGRAALAERAKQDPSMAGEYDVTTNKDGVPTPGRQGAGELFNILKGLAPGGAIGAGGVGGASALMDAVRGKPVHVQRAIVLALTLGLPLGMVSQLAVQGARGTGPGLGGAYRQGMGALGSMWGAGKGAFGQASEKAQSGYKAALEGNK